MEPQSIVDEPRCYYIVRFYQQSGHMRGRRILRRGLTLAEAQAHCSDPETSSRTCKNSAGLKRTRRLGEWFDGYDYAR